MRFANVLAILLVSALVWGCNKEAADPIPEIRFIKQNVNMVADSGIGEELILFEFAFEDGDADIGPIEGKNPNFPSQNVVFTDNRNLSQYKFDFPEIPAKVVQRDGVEGTFQLLFPPSVIIARNDSVHEFTDTLTFDVYVEDAAKNISNTVTTGQIVIKK